MTHDADVVGEILDLHQAEIDAHWAKDIGFFTRDLSTDYVAVSHGEVRRPTAEEIRARFTVYLENTTFAAYEDVAEPIVGCSEDRSLAWAIFQIKVVGRRVMEDGLEHELDFTCAWMTLYRREREKWMRLADVSTFR